MNSVEERVRAASEALKEYDKVAAYPIRNHSVELAVVVLRAATPEMFDEAISLNVEIDQQKEAIKKLNENSIGIQNGSSGEGV